MEKNWDPYTLTPAEYITRMIDDTHDCTLLLPVWSDNDRELTLLVRIPADISAAEKPKQLRCRIRWTADRAATLDADFACFCAELKKLAEGTTSEEGDRIRDIYLRPFDTEDFDREKIEDIRGKKYLRELANELRKTNSPTEDKLRKTLADVSISEEEETLFNAFCDMLSRQAKERIGDGCDAYEVIYCARRLFALCELHAPAVILNREKLALLQAMTVHRYAESVEIIE